MAERKKFSELASLTSITGNEIIPVGYKGANIKEEDWIEATEDEKREYERLREAEREQVLIE